MDMDDDEIEDGLMGSNDHPSSSRKRITHGNDEEHNDGPNKRKRRKPRMEIEYEHEDDGPMLNLA